MKFGLFFYLALFKDLSSLTINSSPPGYTPLYFLGTKFPHFARVYLTPEKASFKGRPKNKSLRVAGASLN